MSRTRISSLVAFSMLGTAAMVNHASGAAIAQWVFGTVTGAPDNSPAPSTGSGTASILGMTNNYTFTNAPITVTGSGTFTYAATGNNTVVGSTADADVLATSGDPHGFANAWRVRGPSNTFPNTTGNGNGWALQAPQYTQGVEFDGSAASYTNVLFSADWDTTAQGVADLQMQYTVNGTTWNNIGGLDVAPSGGGFETVSQDFSGVAGVSGDPSFGVRLVSAYDPTEPIPNYSGASGGYYNDNSGNWRFADVTISGTAVTTAAPVPAALPAGMALIGLLWLARRKVTA